MDAIPRPSAAAVRLFSAAPQGAVILGVFCALFFGACHSRQVNPQPSVNFTRVPRADEGSTGENDIIQGTVIGAQPGQQIVLYAKNGPWWLQPLPNQPFTKIQPNSEWINATHLGTDYSALLVNGGYTPAITTNELPVPGGMVAAVASVKGQKTSSSVIVPFSGYEWRVRNAPSDRGGTRNIYDPANVWTDASGAMHLRISKTSSQWTCAEVSLTRSLGFGTYSFSVRDISRLEPAVVLGMFTWDYAGGDQNNREVDIEISRWGDPASKNAQYVVQPFQVPANVFRFSTPPGMITHSLEWGPDRMSFRSIRESGSIIAHHDFTSGVPSPGLESVRMNVYIYRGGKTSLENGAEVVIDKFQYFP
jgi:hypothetical protein